MFRIFHNGWMFAYQTFTCEGCGTTVNPGEIHTCLYAAQLKKVRKKKKKNVQIMS